MACGLSNSPETGRATEVVVEQCLAALSDNGNDDSVDAAYVFFSPHHVHAVAEMSAIILRKLAPTHLIGISTIASVGAATELEKQPGISMLAARMPGVTAVPFTSEDLPPADENPETLARLAEAIGATDDHRFTLLLADPFSVPLVKMLPALNKCRVGTSKGAIFGGMASAANEAGGNALILNDRVFRSGAVGLSLRGNIRVDTVVSQGCRPFGPTFVVTKSKGNLIMELGGRPAVEAIQDAVNELGEQARVALSGGLFMGRVINEYKGRFGRDDFLIRNVIGFDPSRGVVAVADIFRVGQTIRLHARDAVTAREDLALLLDAQKLYDKPKGALMVTCNARGKRMFDASDHDAAAVARAFAQFPGGEELSKPGKPFDPNTNGQVPLAGFFANGEIGPIGDESFQHGHTACVALFRDM